MILQSRKKERGRLLFIKLAMSGPLWDVGRYHHSASLSPSWNRPQRRLDKQPQTGAKSISTSAQSCSQSSGPRVFVPEISVRLSCALESYLLWKCFQLPTAGSLTYFTTSQTISSPTFHQLLPKIYRALMRRSIFFLTRNEPQCLLTSLLTCNLLPTQYCQIYYPEVLSLFSIHSCRFQWYPIPRESSSNSLLWLSSSLHLVCLLTFYPTLLSILHSCSPSNLFHKLFPLSCLYSDSPACYI